MKIVEELCQDSDCKRRGPHWHPLSVESLVAEPVGQYSLTVRVRETKRKGTKAVKTRSR